MNLKINHQLEIPAKEIQWRFSRSSGPGGQNVNKTDSRAEIMFNEFESKTFTPHQKHKILNQSNVKLINGSICLIVQEKRTQYQNRQIALSRLKSTLRELLKPPPKRRRQTMPTPLSKKKRLESKKRRGEIKKKRQLNIDY